MYYAEPVYRPPSEARSLLVQATVGCSTAAGGHCYFCGSWLFDRAVPDKRFRIRPTDEIIADLEEARSDYGPGIRRIFFLDSNALVMRTAQLAEITRAAYRVFPGLDRVSVYACATDIERKSDEELRELSEAGLKLLYVGLESGNEDVLELHNKGITAAQNIAACRRASAAGIETSVTVILGLGGPERSKAHALDTGRAVSAMSPDYFGALTLMVVPGTPVHDWIEKGDFRLLTQEEVLAELEIMLGEIDVSREMVFRTNHASNYLPLKGNLPADKKRLLDMIRKARERKVPLRPEGLRGL